MNALIKSQYIDPLNGLPLSIFGLIRFNTLFLNYITYSKNSGRSLSKSIFSRFYRFSSL